MISKVCVVLTGALMLANVSSAQIIESNWNSALTSNQDWQVNGNWSTATYPDDPGRVDMDPTVIDPVVGANVSVGLGADLNLNVGASDVTVASLRLGGTAGAVTTTVSSTGGRLVFENRESNDETDPENIIPAYNFGRPLIVSGGVAGSTNTISAPVFINGEALEVGAVGAFESTNDLTISGPITFAGTTPASISNITNLAEVRITGSVIVDDINPSPGEGMANPPDAGINYVNGAAGTVRVTGVVSGAGRVEIGGISEGTGTVVLSAANTISGTVSHGFGTLVLDNDLALGTATLRQGNATGSLGARISSTSDTRTIANEMSMTQYVVLTGDNSLTWTGDIIQRNSRGWVNLLPAGKTLTITGDLGADGDEPQATQNNRIFYFDGSGETIVSGAMRNRLDMLEDQPQSFGVRGTSVVHITGIDNTYSASTFVGGGNLHFATNASLPVATFKSRGGAVGVDTGTVYLNGNQATENSTFLGKLNNRSQAPPTIQGDIKSTQDYDTGGLMLAPSESAVNLNFTTGSLVNARDMSVAAPEDGLSYSGTVTPYNSTYRFGGGTGTITLPGTNQLTGSNSLVATNGQDLGDMQGLGGVRVTGVNNYTGATRVEGRYLSSQTQNAEGVGGGSTAYNGTTLSVTNLANGGANSSIGASSNAASNLVLQGSTLRYEGAGDSTDRLFTIGTHGATLDSSGSGAVAFTNSAALTIGTAGDRSGVTSGLAFGQETGVTDASTTVAFNLTDTSDLVVGMQVTDDTGFLSEDPLDDDEVITVTAIQSPTRFVFSDGLGLFVNFNEDPSTLSFVDVERTFTLTGDNTGDNVLSPAIGDSLTNVVNVAKTGSGKWILDGNNTYTGDTLVSEGTLGVMDGVGTLAAGTNLTLDAGAALEIEIAGVGNNDLLTLTGEATLAGSIDVSLLSGFNPTSGAFDILTAASIVDNGLTITGDGGFTFNIVDGTTLQLVAGVAAGLAGDYNNDGVVDSIDYAVWRENLGAPDGTLANDPIGGVVGTAQFNQWRDNFGATAPGAASVTIPEPAALLLVLLALGGVSGRRKLA